MIKNIFEICTPLPLAFPRGRTAYIQYPKPLVINLCRRHTFEAMSPPPTRRQRHPKPTVCCWMYRVPGSWLKF